MDNNLWIPRRQLLEDIWNCEPWNYQVGDNVSRAHEMMHKVEPVTNIPPSPKWTRRLNDGSTTLLVLMRWTGRQNEVYDSQGKRVEWTGNQFEKVERPVKYVTRNKQQKIWVIFETRQTGCGARVAVRLDGQTLIRNLRKVATKAIYDGNGKWTQWRRETWTRMHHKATRHSAMLLDGREQWRPLTQRHPTKLMMVKAGQYKVFDEDEHIVVTCVVSSKAVKTTHDFYRWVNDKHDFGTSTAYHNTKLPWAEARHMGLVDDNVVAYEYVFPKRLQDEVMSSLRAKEAAFVLMDGDAEGVYILS